MTWNIMMFLPIIFQIIKVSHLRNALWTKIQMNILFLFVLVFFFKNKMSQFHSFKENLIKIYKYTEKNVLLASPLISVSWLLLLDYIYIYILWRFYLFSFILYKQIRFVYNDTRLVSSGYLYFKNDYTHAYIGIILVNQCMSHVGFY